MLTRRSINFLFRSPGPLPIVGGDVNFQRPSPATFIDGQGVVRTVGPNTPRYEWTEVDGVLRPLLLLEPASTNLVTESYALENWNKSATPPIFQLNQPSPAGDLNARWVSTSGTNGAHIVIVVAGLHDGSNSIGLNLKFYESGRHMHFGLYDNTLGWRKLYKVVNNGDAPPTVIQEAGEGTVDDAQAPKKLASGFWRITSRVTGVVAANTNLFYIYPGGTASTGGCWFSGVQAETLSYATSEIETRGATTRREGDLFYFGPPIPVPNPDGVVVYTRWLSNEFSLATEGNARVWEISEAGANTRFLLHIATSAPTHIRNLYQHGSGLSQASATFDAKPGDDCEVLSVLNAPVVFARTYARVNEGTISDGIGSNVSGGFSFGYSGQKMYIGSVNGAAPYALRLVELAFIRLQDMGATPGVATPDAVMREVTDLLSRTTQIL